MILKSRREKSVGLTTFFFIQSSNLLTNQTHTGLAQAFIRCVRARRVGGRGLVRGLRRPIAAVETGHARFEILNLRGERSKRAADAANQRIL